MVFATIDDSNTQLGYIGDVSNAKGSYNDASVVTAKAVMDESREPADDSSESDEGGFDDFMAFLATPGPTSSPEASAPKKVVDNVAPLVKAVPLSEPAKAAPSARRSSWAAAAENVSTRKAAPTSADAAPVKAVPAEKRIQTATQASTIVPNVQRESESSDEEGDEWSSDEEQGTEAEDEAVPAPVPMMKAMSLGRGQMSANAVEVEETVKESASAAVTKPSRRESAPTVNRNASRAEPRFELPKSASVATIHFAAQGLQNAAEIDAARASTQTKEPMEPLPVDHFTKLGDAQMAAKAEESRQLSEAHMPIGTKYFTELAVVEKEKALAEIRAVSESERSVATKYFMKLEEAKKEASSQKGGECDIMPAAIQKFTLEDRAIKEKKRAEIQAMCENPPAMPDGQAYFTDQMRAEKEKTRQELEELKNNPPPASVATEYFKIKESERQHEIDQLMKEPAAPAIEYFTNMANEENKKARAALEKANAEPYEPAAATKYFAEKELQKAAEIDAARANTQTKEPMEPLPVDHFTKLGDAQMAAKAEESRQLSEAHMPIGTKYFTELAVVEKEKALAEIRAVSESERSVATKYFMKLEAEKKASSQNGDGPEIMPAAIQKFTLEDRAIKEKKRAEIQSMCENPPAMPDGQAYFTNQMRAEKEKTRQELEELKNNPPPASVATEYFKIKESERQHEIDQLMKEPAAPAIEYFTNMANEENKKARAALEKANAEPYEPAAATKYFADQELQKAAEIETARAQVIAKRLSSSNKPKVNWAELTQQKAPTVPAYY